MPRRSKPRRSEGGGPSPLLFIGLVLVAALAGLAVTTLFDRPEVETDDTDPWARHGNGPVRQGSDESGEGYVPDRPGPVMPGVRPRNPTLEIEVPVETDLPEGDEAARRDPDAESAGAVRPPTGPTEEERRQAAQKQADAVVLAEWFDVDGQVGEDARKLRFDQAAARLEAFLARLKTAPAKALPEVRLDEVRRQKRHFGRVVTSIRERVGRTVEVRPGLALDLTAVDAERITGKRRSAKLSLRWTDLSGEDFLTLVETVPVNRAEEWIDLAALCHEHDQTEKAEASLLGAFKVDPSVKYLVDETLARRRGEDAPAGGYLVHEGAWVRPEEKKLLEKGFRKWKGKWLSEDEYQVARGFVRHEGRWITKKKWDTLEEQRREREALATKLLPKGLIDKPGHGKAIPWADARVIKTKNYRVRTNLSKDIASDIAYTMETLNWNFRRILGLGTRGMPKFEIQVCRNLNEYRTVLNGRGLGQAGGNMIKTFYQPPRTTAVLLHEGTHQFVYKLSPTCPRWVHEGMATYFECSQFRIHERTKKPVLDVGLLNRNRLMGIQRAINADSHVRMELFLDGKGGNPYTQGWSVIYYLAKAHDGKYAKRLLPFVEDAGKGSTLRKFKKVFHIKDVTAWEQDWKAFVLGLNPKDGIDVFVPESPGGGGGGNGGGDGGGPRPPGK
jgi:Protein of unknown function (DUF1570)